MIALIERVRPGTWLSHAAAVCWLRVYSSLLTRGEWTDDDAGLLDNAAEFAAAHVDLAVRRDPRAAAGAATMARYCLAALDYRIGDRAEAATKHGVDAAIADLTID